MELFRDIKFDWLSRKWIFIGLSVLLSFSGIVSLIAKGGPHYGIDFRGGTQVTIKFRETPPLENLRAALTAQGLGDSSLQRYGLPANNEILVSLGSQETDKQLDAGRQSILKALESEFGVSGEKPNFNEMSSGSIAQKLAQAPSFAAAGMPADQIQAQAKEVADRIAQFRDDPPHNGIITNFDDLKGVQGVTPAVTAVLNDSFIAEPYAIRNVEIVGPKVGAALRLQAVNATLLGLLAMLIYIAFRFEWIYGVAAVLATFHDVIIAIGFLSIFDYEISLTVIAALLTLVGYSVNDTIVVFDRIRENVRLNRREPMTELANRSINQTLSRTVLTSGLTFLSVLSLFLFGGDVLRAFSFTLVVGILVGTYSSISVASTVVVSWVEYTRMKGGRSGAAAERARGAGKRSKAAAGAGA
jgi:preprotein translocase subunit SecF